jgi:hypothetical protein
MMSRLGAETRTESRLVRYSGFSGASSPPAITVVLARRLRLRP